MQVETLQEIATLAVLQSFRKAACALNVSQSVLSKHIAAAEKELGFTLFERQGDFRATAAGASFAADAQRLLSDYGAAREKALALSRQAPPVRLCLMRSSAIRDFLQTTDIPFSVIPDDGIESRASLVASGKADAALCYAESGTPEELEGQGLAAVTAYRERQVIAMSASNPLAGQDKVARGDLAGARFCIWSAPSARDCERAYERMLGFPVSWVSLPELNVSDSLAFHRFGDELFVGASKETHAQLDGSPGVAVLDEVDGGPLYLDVSLIYRVDSPNPNVTRLAQELGLWAQGQQEQPR